MTNAEVRSSLQLSVLLILQSQLISFISLDAIQFVSMILNFISILCLVTTFYLVITLKNGLTISKYLIAVYFIIFTLSIIFHNAAINIFNVAHILLPVTSVSFLLFILLVPAVITKKNFRIFDGSIVMENLSQIQLLNRNIILYSVMCIIINIWLFIPGVVIVISSDIKNYLYYAYIMMYMIFNLFILKRLIIRNTNAILFVIAIHKSLLWGVAVWVTSILINLLVHGDNWYNVFAFMVIIHYLLCYVAFSFFVPKLYKLQQLDNIKKY